MESSVMQHSGQGLRGVQRRVDSIFNTVNQGGGEVWQLHRAEGQEWGSFGVDPILITSHDGKKFLSVNVPRKNLSF
jgi:hypothetical protein